MGLCHEQYDVLNCNQNSFKTISSKFDCKNQFFDKKTYRSYAALRFNRMLEEQRKTLLDLKKQELRDILEQDSNSVPAFNLNDYWPKNPLMVSLMARIDKLLDAEIKKQNILCDKKDALFQTLFRLTTFSPSELFINGEKVLNHIKETGALLDWRKITTLKQELFDASKINTQLAVDIIREQLLIIKERLTSSHLPTQKILSQEGFFDGNCMLEWAEGNKKLFAVRKDQNSDIIDKTEVRFGKVSPEIATAFHRDLHYIHTPRTKAAYGLFMRGEKLPFSVEAIQFVERDYKKNALLVQGLDPAYCMELTRLYNWPGSPLNTTSIMDGLVFSLYKTKYNSIQAFTTAIMPDYSMSKSQISGGMNKVYLLKRLKHIFVSRKINGKKVWEHLTMRRLSKTNNKLILKNHPDFPLLPVIELFKPFKDAAENKRIPFV